MEIKFSLGVISKIQVGLQGTANTSREQKHYQYLNSCYGSTEYPNKPARVMFMKSEDPSPHKSHIPGHTLPRENISGKTSW